MRLYRISDREVEGIVSAAHQITHDDKGNARLTGRADDGREIVVIVAADDPTLAITLRKQLIMRAEFDSDANAISITLRDDEPAPRGDEVHERAVVALSDGQPIEVQILYPDLGIDEPLERAAARYDLDLEALKAAARSAHAAPDRRISVEVELRG